MRVLDHIPFTLDTHQITAQAHMDSSMGEEADLCSLIERAKRIASPKAVYAVCTITDRDGESVWIEGVRFISRTLAHQLRPVRRVFPFIATCGREVDEALPPTGDMLTEFSRDLIKARLLDAAYTHLGAHLHHKYRLEKTVAMHPGSGDAGVWPIEQQAGLFKLIGNVGEAIGVRLTEFFLMVPNKTISGLLFPSETTFRSCQVCRRTPCPSRRAPFKQSLWEDIHRNEPPCHS